MNRRFHSLIAAALALVVVVTLVGCSDTATPTAPPAATAKAATTQSTTAAATAATTAATVVTDTIKLGSIFPLSGAAARSGTASDRWVRFGVDDVNAKGGVNVGGKTYFFNVVSADDKLTSEGSRAAADQLVLGEKVKFMAANGYAFGGGQPTTESNKVLTFIPGPLDAELGPNLPFTLGAGYPNARMRYPALYGQLVKTYPSVKTVALFYDSALLGQTHVGFAQEAAKNAGLTVVATELYATDTKDFGPIVTRVLSQNPDAIDIGAAGSIPANFLALLKALNEQGYHKPMFGLSGAAATLAQAGAQAEGYFFQSLADYTSPAVTAGEKDLIQRYISKYGEGELDTLVVGAGTIVPVLAQAMVKANSVTDTALIAQTLRNAGPWDTLWGKKSFTGVKTFGIAANLDMNLYMTKYEGGKVITFDSFPATLP